MVFNCDRNHKGRDGLPFLDAFVRGILCNVLVCVAVLTKFAAHHVAGKVITIVLPVTVFVTLGFERWFASIYFNPVAMLAGSENVDIADFVADLLPVTLGNIMSGACL